MPIRLDSNTRARLTVTTTPSVDLNHTSFATKAEAAAATIATSINAITTAGYYAAGDGGAARYIKTGSGPAALNRIHSADGAWWELDIGDKSINPRQLGAVGDGATDDQPAFQLAWDLGTRVGGTVAVPPGQYGFASSVVLDGAFFWKTIRSEAGAILKPLANNVSIFTLLANDTIAFNTFRGLSFDNSTYTGCTAFHITGTDLTKFYNNNNWVDIYVNGYENGILLDRVNDPLAPSFDWNVFENVSFRSCNYGFRSLCGSGTGNVWNAGVSECTTAGLAWYSAGTSSSNIGDIVISDIHFGVAATAIHLDAAAGYRANVAITGCQFDAGVSTSINAQNYFALHIVGNNWGGATTYTIVNSQDCRIDLRDARLIDFSKDNLSVASTTETTICTVSTPDFYAGASMDVVTAGLVQGRGESITKSLVLVKTNGSGTPTASVTAIASSFAASGQIVHTATVSGTNVIIKATFTATANGSVLKSNVKATTGAKFNIN